MSPIAFPTTDVQCEEIRFRQRQVRARPEANGVDYVEIKEVHLDQAQPGKSSATIILCLLKGARIVMGNLRIDDLVITGIQLPEGVAPQPAEEQAANPPQVYHVSVQGYIDQKAIYTLRIHAAGDVNHVLPGFDPLFSEARFSFFPGDETDQDLAAEKPCPPRELDEPEMHYLAKDYASFRQLVLDRLALIMPQWRERHIPDLGITLVELLAYVGDHLSYYQDAVGTEAYLDTARQRISVRRHVRLVDYDMHEGCNARALLCLTVTGNPTLDLANVYLVTDQGLTFPLHDAISRKADLERAVKRARYEIFEPIERVSVTLYQAHNRIDLYTWGERACCLPRGATRAALRDGSPLFQDRPQDEQEQKAQSKGEPEPQAGEASSLATEEEWLRKQLDAGRILRLKPGDLLVLEEIADPGTGLAEDADPTHRHAVRLTRVTPSYDLLNRQALLEVEWARADALPFPLCLSAVSNDCDYLEGISVARGNVIPVDHGETVGEELDPVAPASPQPACDECGEVQVPGARHYNPHLARKHVVFREPLRLEEPVWYLLHHRNPDQALPQVELQGAEPQTDAALPWWPRRDLLSSGGDDRHFVVEVDDGRMAYLRFGDDELGKAPSPGTRFSAVYRVGEPMAGNVAAEAIRRLIVRQGIVDGVTAVRNPLAAAGGTAPETVAETRRRAPHAFRQRMLRAITPGDYARLVEQLFPDQVQRAYAALAASPQAGRHNVTIWFDLLSGAELTPGEMVDKIATGLYPYRRIGHDLTVQPGTLVPLDVEITVQIEERAVGEQVQEAIQMALGPRAFFCPDRLTFDAGISLSEMVAIAQAVPGVAYVKELVVKSTTTGAEESWPDTTVAGDDLMTFVPGQIPGLGTLAVNWE